MYDVVIIGGGPAGLSAALVLGRCRRRVLVCDAGAPRNAKSRALHGYLTRDGVPPLDLLRYGRDELGPYGIEFRHVTVSDIAARPRGFDVVLTAGVRLFSRTVLLASGTVDELPAIPGLEQCYGITAHHCPYCDGWESREKPIGVTGRGRGATALALSLKTWSDRISVLLNGSRLQAEHQLQLADNNIDVYPRRIVALEHQRIQCEAVFVAMPQRQQCELPRRLGCDLTHHGLVKTDHLGQTRVPGVYVAGDASRDVQFAIVAAAEGAKAAVAINKALQKCAGLALTS